MSYQELIDQAGISRGMVRRALDETIAGHLVRCVREGRPSRAGNPAVSALYELCWDRRGETIERAFGSMICGTSARIKRA